MTEPKPTEPAPDERPAWTTPAFEDAGTIHDVAGGGTPGLDFNGIPSHS